MTNFSFFSKTLFLLAIIVFAIACDDYNQETVNGFQYKIHHQGNGEKVSYDHYIYTWFSITTGDTILFETNEIEGKRVFLEDPSKISAKIKDPVLDILPYLSVGDSATVVVIVDDLMRLSDDLKDVEKLYYQVVVKSIETKEERNKAEQADRNRRANTQKEDLGRRVQEMKAHPEGGIAYQRLNAVITDHAAFKQTESGLEYIILNEGEKPFCQSGEQIGVHYIGMQEEGTVFDETYSLNKAFNFALDKGRVIKAWDEGIQLLGLNGEAFFKVPPGLGYGATGYKPLIKPNATLYFYVKVMKKNNL